MKKVKFVLIIAVLATVSAYAQTDRDDVAIPLVAVKNTKNSGVVSNYMPIYIQKDSCVRAEFRELYEKAFLKLNSGESETIEYAVYDTLGKVKISYEASHDCLCNNERCHGPRITVLIGDKAASTIFPDGDFFVEINHPGFITRIDLEKEAEQEKIYQQETERVLGNL